MICPRCGGIQTRKDGGKTRADGGWAQKYSCRGCGHKWTPDARFVAIAGGAGEPVKSVEQKTVALEPKVMIGQLQKLGYTIIKEPPTSEQRVNVFAGRFDDIETFKFGVFSCPHLCSRYQQLSALRSFYKRAADEGVTLVLCAGDIFDGDGYLYKGQQYELFMHGYDGQLDYGIDNFPHEPGIKTVAISGNHDFSFYAREGADIVKALAAKRPDIEYYGHTGAYIEFGDSFRTYLMHGKSGGAYARSYKTQKIVEQFAPQGKPEMLLAGHWHTFNYMPMYRNVITWQLGCFQSQTPFEKARGLYPEIAGLIMSVDMGRSDIASRKKGTVNIRHDVVPFYVPLEKDW